MAADSSTQSALSFSGKLYTVLLGAAIILLTTTVPYLTLLNVFLFAGVFLAGTIALNHAILRFQVRLPYSEAFFLGCVAGMAGGVLSESVTFLLMQQFNYRPGAESLSLIIDWALEMAKGKPELQDQVQALVTAEKLALAPVKLSFRELLMNMAFSGAFYAPMTGLGAAYAVLRLKRKARKA
ncbi:MAG: hypothetical protein HGA99_04845 [Chlorobiaceae bacterium]|nr:hypothetical protein [Chlorobiaceae bacterium]